MSKKLTPAEHEALRVRVHEGVARYNARLAEYRRACRCGESQEFNLRDMPVKGNA